MSHLNIRNALLLGLACSSIALTACQKPATETKADEVKAEAKAEDNTDAKAEDKAETKTEEHKEAHWGYGEDGTVAPAKWGEMEGNTTCKIGKKQSPIDIETVEEAKTPLDFTQEYQAENFTAKNNGHTVVFNAEAPAKNSISVNGKSFNLLQFHYHAPSEHTIKDKSYPLAIHFVHKSEDGQLAVVGVLYEVGEDNAGLAKVAENLVTEDKEATLSAFDVNSIMPKDKATLAYSGSLTTPPCSEDVQWLVQKTPVNIGQGQLEKFTSLYDDNNRPVQPQNDRKVSLN